LALVPLHRIVKLMGTTDICVSLKGWRLLWLAVLAAFVFSGVARVPQAGVPFERDEGAYAYMSNVIDQGGLPYRDAFDHKPPGIYYIYNLSFRLFGHDVRAPRIMALLFVAVSCVVTFVFVYKTIGSISAGVLSMGLLAWGSASPAYAGFGANTEIFMLPFIAAGTLCLVGGGFSKRTCFSSGLLYGVAFTIKQIALPIALFSFVCLVVHQWRSRRKLFITAIVFFAGLLLPFALFTVWFSVQGGFKSYWAGFFVYNQSYATTLALVDIWNNLQQSMRFIFSLDPGTWLAAYLGILTLWLSPVKPYYKFLIIAPLVGSLIAIATGGYFFPHYFVILLPYFSMAAGIGGAAFGLHKAKHLGKWFLTLLLIGSAIIGFRFSMMSNVEKLQVVYGSDLFSRALTVGRFLNSLADKNATVFIIGSEPEILFYANLHASNRIYYYYPLTQPSPLRNDFRNEVMSSIINRPPEFLVQVNYPSSLSLQKIVRDSFTYHVKTLFSDYQPFGICTEGADHVSLETGVPGMELANGSIIIYKRTDSNQAKSKILNPQNKRSDPR
jgi:hypothetical protein